VKELNSFAHKERLLNSIVNAIERYKAKKAAKDTEENLKAILNSINEAVIATDNLGIITHINPVATQLTRWTYNEALGKNLAEVFTIEFSCLPEEQGSIYSLILQQATNNEIIPIAILRSKDNLKVKISYTGALIRDKNEKITGIVLVFRDISKEQEKAHKFKLFQYAIEKSSSVFFLVGIDGKIKSVNKAACEKLGYTMDEILELKLTDIDINISKIGWNEYWESSKGKSFTFNSMHIDKYGKIHPVEVTRNYVEMDDTAYCFVYVRYLEQEKSN
jgi:PAS domain S-box-containing protein